MRRPPAGGLAAAVAVTALALSPLAAAHVTIAPPFVNDGVPATIAFQVPNERSPHATVHVSVTAPPGITMEPAAPPAGWTASVSGATTTWTGGRIEGRTTTEFPVRVTAKVRAGSHAFAATQGYDDARTVRWSADLSVLPATGSAAPKQDPGAAVAAGVIGLVVVALSVAGLRYLRRRPAPGA